MSRSDELVERVVAALPELRGAWEADRALASDGFADVAAEVFLGAAVQDRVERFRAGDVEALRVLLAVLEREYGGADDAVLEAAVVPALRRGGEPDPATVLGPRLGALVAAQRGWRARPQDAALVARLVREVPALGPLTTEHRYGDAQDVLAHPFLGDVVRRQAEEQDPVEAARVFAVLDQAWSEVPDLLATAVVESLPYPDEEGAQVVDWLGPRLRAELERQRPGVHGPRA